MKINIFTLLSFLILALLFTACEEPDPDLTSQTITSFIFLKEDIGWAEDFVGAINHSARTITFTTQKWIDNIDQLPAVFKLDVNKTASVNGIPQQSGVTQNDFRKEVIYKLSDDTQYTVRFVSPQATGLPVIKIDTLNAAPILSRETWVTMTFSLSDPNDPKNDIPAIDNQQIRGRGNSTWSYDPGAKNPYRIRFRNNQQQSPFGLPAARNWVLLRSGQEINTSIGFELGRRLGLKYTCTYHHVELYLNNDYRGTYLFTEHRQADPAVLGAPGRPKVDLNEGWFVEIDRRHDEEPRFRTNDYNLPVIIKSPVDDNNVSMTNPLYHFVRDDWNELTRLMACASFPDNGYRDLVDIDTFAKYFIVQTIIMNKDLFRPRAETGEEIGSTFFYKDKGGRISAGPLWDLDWSLSSYPFEGREFLPNSFPYQIHPFFNRFFDDPVFHARYIEIWNENYIDNILSMSSFIDDLADKIRLSAIENNRRWSSSASASGFNWHINSVKEYYNARIVYLNAEYNKPKR